MNYYRSLEDRELPDDALALLAKYEEIAPFLVPPSNCIAAANNTLWHPDLHLDNVFIDLVSHKITGIIDWQSAVVAPMFYQSGVHRAFRHYKPVREGWVVPEKPENFDTLPPDDQKRIDKDLESETIHKYYELQTMTHVPLHWDVLQQSSVPKLTKPVWLVTGVWENKDLFFLRHSLIALVAEWNQIFGQDTPCPITFSKAELELHAKEEVNIDMVLGRCYPCFKTRAFYPQMVWYHRRITKQRLRIARCTRRLFSMRQKMRLSGGCMRSFGRIRTILSKCLILLYASRWTIRTLIDINTVPYQYSFLRWNLTSKLTPPGLNCSRCTGNSQQT